MQSSREPAWFERTGRGMSGPGPASASRPMAFVHLPREFRAIALCYISSRQWPLAHPASFASSRRRASAHARPRSRAPHFPIIEMAASRRQVEPPLEIGHRPAKPAGSPSSTGSRSRRGSARAPPRDPRSGPAALEVSKELHRAPAGPRIDR